MQTKEDIKKLIIAHSRRLQMLKEKQALQGINASPEILTEIEDIELEIRELQAQLGEDEDDSESATQKRATSKKLEETQLIEEIEKLINEAQKAYQSRLFRTAFDSLDKAEKFASELSANNKAKWEDKLQTLRHDVNAANEVWDIFTKAHGILRIGQYQNDFEKLQEAQSLFNQILDFPATNDVIRRIQSQVYDISTEFYISTAIIRGDMEEVERRLISRLVLNPQDITLLHSLRRVQAANYLRKVTDQIEEIQVQTAKNFGERQLHLKEYTKIVRGEAKWWYITSLVSAVVAFGIFIFAVLSLVQSAEPLSYLTPLYTFLPGLLSVLFFNQYLKASQRVDDERNKVWQQTEEAEKRSTKEIDAIRTQLLKDIQSIEIAGEME